MRLPCLSRLLILCAAALALSGCSLFADHASMRFRVTVEVETPDGVRTGSSVMEVRSAKYVRLTSEERSGSTGLIGEAVVVDLPDGPLFALLVNDEVPPRLARRVVAALDPNVIGQQSSVETVRRLGASSAELKAALPREHWPRMVTFADITDPTSVALVDPDNLAATFGEGTTLKRITVQITDDPVTTGIEERLGQNFFKKWAQANRATRSEIGLEAQFRTLSGQISRNDFISE